jgi:hypothetical protein
MCNVNDGFHPCRVLSVADADPSYRAIRFIGSRQAAVHANSADPLIIGGGTL